MVECWNHFSGLATPGTGVCPPIGPDRRTNASARSGQAREVIPTLHHARRLGISAGTRGRLPGPRPSQMRTGIIRVALATMYKGTQPTSAPVTQSEAWAGFRPLAG